MTNAEFNIWAKRLFVCFPSLKDWLDQTSDPVETQKVWRKCLEPYTLDECMTVVEEWSTGVREPFAAYERDHVHLRVRSRIAQERDRRQRRSESVESHKPYRVKRQAGCGTAQIGLGSNFDCNMVAATKEGAEVHRKFIDGELSESDWLDKRDEILRRYGI